MTNYRNAMKAAYRIEKAKNSKGRQRAVKAWAVAVKKMLGA